MARASSDLDLPECKQPLALTSGIIQLPYFFMSLPYLGCLAI